jgi:hypothetical protein
MITLSLISDDHPFVNNIAVSRTTPWPSLNKKICHSVLLSKRLSYGMTFNCVMIWRKCINIYYNFKFLNQLKLNIEALCMSKMSLPGVSFRSLYVSLNLSESKSITYLCTCICWYSSKNVIILWMKIICKLFRLDITFLCRNTVQIRKNAWKIASYQGKYIIFNSDENTKNPNLYSSIDFCVMVLCPSFWWCLICHRYIPNIP